MYIISNNQFIILKKHQQNIKEYILSKNPRKIAINSIKLWLLHIPMMHMKAKVKKNMDISKLNTYKGTNSTLICTH